MSKVKDKQVESDIEAVRRKVAYIEGAEGGYLRSTFSLKFRALCS